jgi:hypothetical protein
MLEGSFVGSFPLSSIALISSAIVLLSIEVGWRLGVYRRKHTQEENNTPIGAAVGAILGLLAFLLAFTFNMSASRYDSRKQIVVQEANAIGTTYLRTDLLPEQLRSQARPLLREYLTIRAGGVASILSLEGMAKSTALQDRLWAIATTAGAQSNSYTTGLFIQSLNEMIDIDTVRVAANRNRIPDSIWLMLGVVSVLSMAALGYQFGLSGKRSWPITILLVIVFATVIMLIADLDLPQAGLLKVSQQPLLDLLSRIGTTTP